MIVITEKENEILDSIKKFHEKYEDGISLNVLKDDLGMYEHDLHHILLDLTDKNLIEYSYSVKLIKLLDVSEEIDVVGTKEDIENLELNKKEVNTLNLIKQLIDEDNKVSKYILEGNLLYGSNKLSNFQLYHILLSLEIKGLIKKLKLRDGEYYKLMDA